MSIESGQNFISKPIDPEKESSLKKELLDVKEKMNSLLGKETMFTSFESCEKELELLKENGTYREPKTPEGELAAENGLPSKYKDYPLLYGVLQTPTFKKIIGDGTNNFAVYEDTREPMIVYHSTPIDIPLDEGLKPNRQRLSPGRVLGQKDSLLMSFRRKFKLFPMTNLRLYFAQDANSTKNKAVASTRERNDPHRIYPCFIRISNPYSTNDVNGYKESEYSLDASDGTIETFRGDTDFSVKSEKQIMHIPFNFVGIYTPEKQ